MAVTSRRSSRRLTFTVLAAGAGFFAMLQSLITPVLPTIQHDLHTSQNTVTWVLTAYLLSASIFTPILGRVGDMVGKERMLVVALAALALGCLLAAIAPTIGVLILARVVQGIGGAVFPLSFGIIRDEFPAARVSSAVAAISAIVAVGGGLGIVLAGPIVSTLDYRWLFWIPMVVVGLTAVAAHLFVPESPIRTPGRIDWRATVLLSGWLVALLLPISQGAAWGWTSPRVLGLLALAVVLLVGWLVAEVRSPNPLIDMRMMRLPGVWTTNLVALLYGASMFSVYAFLPQFVQTPTAAGYGFGASISQAGLLMLPMLVAMFVAGLVAGRLQAVFSAKAQLATGAAFNVAASAMLAAAHDTRWEVAIAGGLVGLGIGLAFASMANLIVASVPASQTGVATGMNANIRTIGGAIGAAVVSGVITANPQANGLPREAGFTMGFLVLTAIALAAALAALAVPSARRKAAGPRPSTATIVESELAGEFATMPATR
ncbi:MFS transporter [Micromonospora zamorensis]|uniref:MFS transporter n=1 Tax=Micromonospora zamorensis TaxID=709883 RepID=UPI0033B154E2